MRTTIMICLAAIALLNGCSKASLPVNFSCQINGNPIQGNAAGKYSLAVGGFGVAMSGPNGQQVTLAWYGIDSPGAISRITPQTYTIPAIQLPPAVLTGGFTVSSQNASYATGLGRNLGGSITITKNTGPGGLISGTFYFNALNTNTNYIDTVHITAGSFTNVSVPAN